MVNNKQKKILTPDDTRTTGFAQDFRSSNQLASKFNQHQAEKAAGKKTGNAVIKQLDTEKYMNAYANAPKRPPEEYIEKQELMSDLHRQQADKVRASKDPHNEDRMDKREAFLEGRRLRHDAAIKEYDDTIAKLHENCVETLGKSTKKIKEFIVEADESVDGLLFPIEKESGDVLGEKSEEFVNDILAKLEDGIAARGEEIEDYKADLLELEEFRKAEAYKNMEIMAEKCTAAAHASPGEVERIVETKAFAINNLTLANTEKATEVYTKLMNQNMEKSKEHKRRWYQGLLRWKRQRHITAVQACLARIESREYRLCPEFVAIMDKVRNKQLEVFAERKEIMLEVFNTPIDKLSSNRLRMVEEQINSLNERTAEEADNVFVELKELKDTLQHKGDAMLNQLRTELEMYDARIEWGDHESIKALIDADIRPHLIRVFELVDQMCLEVAQVMQTLDEVAHHTVAQMNSYALKIATNVETFKQQMHEMKVKHQGDIDDCKQDHEEECKNNENRMLELKAEMEDSVHEEDLAELLQTTFAQLDTIAASYRRFAHDLLEIHRSYEGIIHEFFRATTDVFIPLFGIEREKEQDEIEKEEAEAAEAAAAADGGATEAAKTEGGASGEAAEEPPELDEWGGKPMTYCYKLLQKLNDTMLRLQVVPPIEEEEAAEDDDDGEQKAPLSKEVKEELALVNDKVGRIPKSGEGIWLLEELIFKAPLVESLIDDIRKRLFIFLDEHKTELDEEARAVLAEQEEEINMQLDQRLRKHTNRKGEVQVEWFNPRHTTIEKHKTKFERHLITVAQKSAAQEEEGEECYKLILQKEEEYHKRLEELTEQLAEMKSLAELTALERRGKDACGAFTELCRMQTEVILKLAVQGPGSLVALNRDFVKMCRAGAGKTAIDYSKSELVFYLGEMEILNKALKDKRTERTERMNEQVEKLPAMQQEPLEKFLKAYEEAKENLCRDQGLGRKYGAPRRSAQEQCRTMMSRTATALHSITEMLKYMKDLLHEKDTPGGKYDNKLRLHRIWKEIKPPLACEVVGALHFVAMGILSLGSHLKAFKPRWEGKHKDEEKNVRALCVTDERFIELPNKDKEEPGTDKYRVAQREGVFKDDIIVNMLGHIPHAGLYPEGILEVEKAAIAKYPPGGKDYPSGLPDFMKSFLERMKASAESHRQANCEDLRELIEQARGDHLLSLGPYVFKELVGRGKQELRDKVSELTRHLAKILKESDTLRLEHEKRLTPSLANPNYKKQLDALCNAEDERHAEAVRVIEEHKTQFAELLQGEAKRIACNMHCTFDEAITIIDALPMGTHYNPLPGDEALQEARMSIKRRKRRVYAGHVGPIVIDHEVLPPRTWEGLPAELWKLPGEFWDGTWTSVESDEAAEAAAAEAAAAAAAKDKKGGKGAVEAAPVTVSKEEKLQKALDGSAKFYPDVPSFKSPVHKRTFRARNRVYTDYEKEFEKQLAEVTKNLKARLAKENVGDENWHHMTRQLLGEEEHKDEEEGEAAPA